VVNVQNVHIEKLSTRQLAIRRNASLENQHA